MERSLCFFMKKSLGDLDFALPWLCRRRDGGGVHLGLLIPAIEQSEDMGELSLSPRLYRLLERAVLLLLDRLIPHLHVGSEQARSKNSLGAPPWWVLFLPLPLPEWRRRGVWAFFRAIRRLPRRQARCIPRHCYSEFSRGCDHLRSRAEGNAKGPSVSRRHVLGVVEPIGVLTLLAAQLVIPALPYLLSFGGRHALCGGRGVDSGNVTKGSTRILEQCSLR